MIIANSIKPILFVLIQIGSFGNAQEFVPPELNALQKLPINTSGTHISIIKKCFSDSRITDVSSNSQTSKKKPIAFACAIQGYNLFYVKCPVNSEADYKNFIDSIIKGTIRFDKTKCPFTVQDCIAKLQRIEMGKHDQWTNKFFIKGFDEETEPSFYFIQIVNNGDYFQYTTRFFENNDQLHNLTSAIESYISLQ